MSSKAVDPSRTTYSFANPMLPWINEVEHMQEDAYGLYRSANVAGVSEKNLMEMIGRDRMLQIVLVLVGRVTKHMAGIIQR